MPTIDVDSFVTDSVQRVVPYGFAVQRFFRNDGISSTEKDAAAAAMVAAGIETMIYHWSGGYSEATGTPTQQWSTRDHAGGPLLTSPKVYANGSYRGFDGMLADIARFRAAGAPNATIWLVLHDYPQPMLGGRTRTDRSSFSAPDVSYWGATYFGSLFQALMDRELATRPVGQPNRIGGVLFGQEHKGWPNQTSVATLDKWAACGTAALTWLRANHPTLKLGFPHQNNWASFGSIAGRQAAMNALLAGGNLLEASDETINRGLMQRIDPALFDFWTTDNSILNNTVGTSGSGDTWRPGSGGSYDIVRSKVAMEYHVCRVLQAMMTQYWGLAKKIIAVESYFDVNQTAQDWANRGVDGVQIPANSAARRGPTQSSALSTTIYMNGLRASKFGLEAHVRWEPQEGSQETSPGNTEAPDGNIASFHDKDGVAYQHLLDIGTLKDNHPVGSHIIGLVTNPDADLVVVPGEDFTSVYNQIATPKTNVIVRNRGTESAPQTIPGYTLATFVTPDAGTPALPPTVEEIKGVNVPRNSSTLTAVLAAPCAPGDTIVVAAISNENTAGINPVTFDASGLPGGVGAGAGQFVHLVGVPYRPGGATTALVIDAWMKKTPTGGEQTFTIIESDALAGSGGTHPASEIVVVRVSGSNGALSIAPATAGSGTGATNLDSASATPADANTLAIAILATQNLTTPVTDAGGGDDGFGTALSGVANEGNANNQAISTFVYAKTLNSAAATQLRRDRGEGSNARYATLLLFLEAEEPIPPDDPAAINGWGTIPI